MHIIRLSLVMLLSNLWFVSPLAAYTPIRTMNTPMLFVGALQFPKTIEHVPTVRIYYSGTIVTAHLDDVRKQITFTLPEERRKTSFSLLITKNISFQNSEKNTIEYLTAAGPYKYYELGLTKHNNVTRTGFKQKNLEPVYAWDVIERKLPASGRIPDACIIVLFDPALVDGLDQGNAIELPTIVVKASFGSEQQLHKIAERIILEALDSDTLHARIDYTTVQNRYPKTTLALVT